MPGRHLYALFPPLQKNPQSVNESDIQTCSALFSGKCGDLSGLSSEARPSTQIFVKEITNLLYRPVLQHMLCSYLAPMDLHYLSNLPILENLLIFVDLSRCWKILHPEGVGACVSSKEHANSRCFSSVCSCGPPDELQGRCAGRLQASNWPEEALLCTDVGNYQAAIEMPYNEHASKAGLTKTKQPIFFNMFIFFMDLANIMPDFTVGNLPIPCISD